MKLEDLRLGLIKWNIAPLSIVALLAFLTYWMVSVLLAMPPCAPDTVNALYVALSGLITVLCGFLFNMYQSMQKDRGKCDHEHKDQ